MIRVSVLPQAAAPAQARNPVARRNRNLSTPVPTENSMSSINYSEKIPNNVIPIR